MFASGIGAPACGMPGDAGRPPLPARLRAASEWNMAESGWCACTPAGGPAIGAGAGIAWGKLMGVLSRNYLRHLSILLGLGARAVLGLSPQAMAWTNRGHLKDRLHTGATRRGQIRPCPSKEGGRQSPIFIRVRLPAGTHLTQLRLKDYRVGLPCSLSGSTGIDREECAAPPGGPQPDKPRATERK